MGRVAVGGLDVSGVAVGAQSLISSNWDINWVGHSSFLQRNRWVA